MRGRRRRWLVAAVLIAVPIALGFLFTGPAPPRRITLATGQPGGMYHTFGGQYVARLKGIGLGTVVVPTSGSLDNLQRVLRGEADLAFAQGGTAALVPDPTSRLRGIAALYLEPLWVFHRAPTLRSLSELAGQRVSIGLPGSGTEAVATALLREHGIDPASSDIVRLANPAARPELEQGALRAAFFVTGPGDPLVTGLLAHPDVRLLGFRRDAAYARKYPALTPVRLPEGLLDLRRNLPREDKMLLAPAALLVCRADLHPRVVEQVLKVAQAIHAPGSSLLDPPLRFPTREGVDLPLHEAAEVYLTQGESWLSRTLPYPMLRWMPILRVLVVSLVLWIPLMRFLPEVLGWRVERRFNRLYVALRGAERRLESARDVGELRAGLAALDDVSHEAQVLCDKLPPGRQHDVYDWRVHVEFVRARATARLAAMDSQTEG
jgi:TRAP transporter TAXI family solute receptor